MFDILKSEFCCAMKLHQENRKALIMRVRLANLWVPCVMT